MRRYRFILYSCLICSYVAFSVSCNFVELAQLYSGGVEETFENGDINDMLSLYSLGDSEWEIKQEGGNSYLRCAVTGGTAQTDRIIFAFNKMKSTLPFEYTINYDIYFEQIDSTAMVAHRFLLPPHYLRFYVYEDELYADAYDGIEHPAYGGYQGVECLSGVPMNIWLPVEIEVKEGNSSSTPEDDRNPRKYTIHVNNSSASISDQVRKCSYSQQTFIEAHSGAVTFRIDNFKIEF